MNKIRQVKKNKTRARRAARVRAKVVGTAQRPRLSVFRSAKHVSAQLIDDATGTTLASASDAGVKVAKGSEMSTKVAIAYEVGKIIAENAKKAGVEAVIFDRGSYIYTGRVKALAEAARENGLKF